MPRLLRRNGVVEQEFAARSLAQSLVIEADLVLAVTRAQRSHSVELWRPSARRSFALREFARLLREIDASALPQGTPPERLQAAMPLTVVRRSFRRAPAKDDDAFDHFRFSDEIDATSFTEMTAAVRMIVAVLLPGRPWKRSMGNIPAQVRTGSSCTRGRHRLRCPGSTVLSPVRSFHQNPGLSLVGGDEYECR
jgi:protein-tyrosine-phosphatase